jgi:L-2-hydroxyglutarate oxidase LhgO
MADIDVLIIGAGMVGLGVGRALAQAGKSVIIVEKNQNFGEEISSRNSEVIHAGMYYPTNSLKAQFCVRGNQLIYDFCQKRNIIAKPIGKLILATNEGEVTKLEKIYAQGIENNVPQMQILQTAEIKTLEPEVSAIAAIYAKTSGIMDSHSIMLAMLGDIEDCGGALAKNSPFLGAQYKNNYWEVAIGGAEPTIISANNLILSAGLWSGKVANLVNGLDAQFIPNVKYAKGNYFRYLGKAPFSHLLYPIPNHGGLGIHLTPDAAGHARFGPDVEEIQEIDYRPNAARLGVFADSIKSYWPKINPDLLAPDYAGIRPKIGENIEEFTDFKILDENSHKLAGLICLFGIDSPGLTSSMAIGEYVAQLDCIR